MTSSPNKPITSPHTHTVVTVNAIMRQVIYALIPGTLVSIYYFGVGVLVHCLMAIVFALLSEALVLKCRKQKVAPALKDGTA